MWFPVLSVFLSLCLIHADAGPLTTEEAVQHETPSNFDDKPTHESFSPATISDIKPPQVADVCRLGPMKKGALIECEAYVPMYTFSWERGSCEGYIYGGCGGSENLFTTRADCENRCKQHLKREKRSSFVDFDEELIAEE
ncbi:hypothetical protein B566_EDAN008715 [Ephemera danica]|nr:hypothetical protein B566_EDAN008715 [Ephemera danica]